MYVPTKDVQNLPKGEIVVAGDMETINPEIGNNFGTFCVALQTTTGLVRLTPFFSTYEEAEETAQLFQ